jgi:hypothetical protein
LSFKETMLLISLYIALAQAAPENSLYRRTVEMATPGATYSEDTTVRQIQQSLERMRARLTDIRFAGEQPNSAEKLKSLNRTILTLKKVLTEFPETLPDAIDPHGQRVRFADNIAHDLPDQLPLLAPPAPEGSPRVPVRSTSHQLNIATTPERWVGPPFADGSPNMPMRSSR